MQCMYMIKFWVCVFFLYAVRDAPCNLIGKLLVIYVLVLSISD